MLQYIGRKILTAGKRKWTARERGGIQTIFGDYGTLIGEPSVFLNGSLGTPPIFLLRIIGKAS